MEKESLKLFSLNYKLCFFNRIFKNKIIIVEVDLEIF